MTPGLLLFALVDAVLSQEYAWCRKCAVDAHARPTSTRVKLQLNEESAQARSRLGQWRALWWETR